MLLCYSQRCTSTIYAGFQNLNQPIEVWSGKELIVGPAHIFSSKLVTLTFEFEVFPLVSSYDNDNVMTESPEAPEPHISIPPQVHTGQNKQDSFKGNSTYDGGYLTIKLVESSLTSHRRQA